jgi:hypothetical protein
MSKARLTKRSGGFLRLLRADTSCQSTIICALELLCIDCSAECPQDKIRYRCWPHPRNMVHLPRGPLSQGEAVLLGWSVRRASPSRYYAAKIAEANAFSE